MSDTVIPIKFELYCGNLKTAYFSLFGILQAYVRYSCQHQTSPMNSQSLVFLDHVVRLFDTRIGKLV